MNRFIIDKTPEAIAMALCNKHVVKMPLEEAQMLCTAMHIHAPKDWLETANLYRQVHTNHPCTIWARHTSTNYRFALDLFKAMLAEYTYRYDKVHASSRLIDKLEEGEQFIPRGVLTPHPECFSEHINLKDGTQWPVRSYRLFYFADKREFLDYKRRPVPYWIRARLRMEQLRGER